MYSPLKKTHIFDKFQAIFFSAMADDSLNVKKMNVNSGGKQPLMRPGWFVKHGVRFKQTMVFEGGRFAGQAKGLRTVCEERFGVEAVKGLLFIEIFYTKNLLELK